MQDALGTRRARLLALSPFMALFVGAYGLAWIDRGGPTHTVFVVAAGAVLVGVGLSLVSNVWTRVDEIFTLVPVVAVCIAIHFLRAGSESGSSAGYGALLLIPVIWQALRRRQPVLITTIVAVSVANVIAVVTLPSSVSSVARWRSVVLFSLVAYSAGQTIHRLVLERANLLDAISSLATRDPLTGLANRRAWDERVPLELHRSMRTGRPATVALLDLDHFKAYNDRRGHQAGDDLLVAASRAWEQELRGDDLLVRFGGEEFALLLPDADADEAEQVLARLRHVMPAGQTFSAGYAVAHLDPTILPDAGELLARADAAMYQAKEAGRDRVQRADPRTASPDPAH